MSFEKYKQIYKPENDITLRYGNSTEFVFRCDENEVQNKSHRLFFTGETTLFYFWKGEYDCVAEYCNIEDALDNKRALKAPYCLDLSNEQPVPYPKVAFKKTVFPPMLSYLKLHSYNDEWKAGVFVKAKDLSVYKADGYIKLTYEVRYKKPDLPAYYTNEEPDVIYTLDIPHGTYDWQDISLELNLPKERIANVICYIEGDGYTGELLLERPYLTSSNGYNVLPDFQPPYLAHDAGAWIGHNLSRKEWPEFEIKLNGTVFFNGEMFERCHRYSECECDIPDGLMKAGENRLEIKLVSSYPNPMPYSIHEVGYFIRENDEFNVIACPKNAEADSQVSVLVKTLLPNIKVDFECESGLLSAQSTVFENKGLNVFVLNTKEPANDIKFTLKTENTSKECVLCRVVEKADDGVCTGTGDIIYVNQERMSDIEEYLEWYISNNIGNLLTIRPTYRWSGARVLNEDAWSLVTDILNKMNMKYVHMTDGREFPGATANPSLKMLEGKGFMGRQSHEYDGAFIYWGHSEVTGIGCAVSDYWMRLVRSYPETVNTRAMPRNYTVDKKTGKLYNYVDPYNVPDDMEGAAKLLVKNLSESRADHTRHTGPSVAFKYFYQAGYEWSSAELMYGPLEMITAFMRGAAYCYDSKKIGGHLAIQWSTTPHDTPDRFRRYRASLYSSYIQGIHDINTEEGLWHLEEYYSYFNRESNACLSHKKQQQDFYDYISSHSRTGSFYTPFAFVFGRYDGFRSFGRDTVWARADFNTETPELSWELLNIFYPLEVANGEIYLHPCPSDREIGMLTGTPRGNIDAVPIECTAKKLQAYKVLAFLGYNKALAEDFDKLCEYVENGGTLVIGWPHMSTTVLRSDVIKLNHEYIDHEFVRNFADGIDFAEDTLGGLKLNVNKALKLDNADVISTTDSGAPLLVKYGMGKGSVYLINAKEYPAEKSVEPVYRQVITMLSDSLNAEEKSFIKCDERVQFALYEQEDNSRHIYVLAVDWYNDPSLTRSAEFVLNGKSYPLEVPFCEPIKIVVSGDTAAWTENSDAEVLVVCEKEIKVQGYKSTSLCIVHNGVLEKKELDFTENAVATVKL